MLVALTAFFTKQIPCSVFTVVGTGLSSPAVAMSGGIVDAAMVLCVARGAQNASPLKNS